MYFQSGAGQLIDKALIRVRHLMLGHQLLNDWPSVDAVCYFQTAFPLNTTSKPGEGHPGPTEHYVNGLLVFVAGQLAARLAFPSYRGHLINPKKPGSPEIWQERAFVTAAVPPEMILPPQDPPLTMEARFMPVSK
jgi:hypothetical protein